MKSILNYLHKKLDCFVIFTVPRSGSNLLCGCLNSHPEIICHHELFHPQDIYYSLDHRDGDINYTIKARDKNPIQFICSVSRKKFGKKISGFKMMPGHNREAEEYILKNKSIKKIILNRENKLKTFVSLKLAEKTNSYSSLKSANEKLNLCCREKIFIEYEELKKNIQNVESYFNRILNYLSGSKQKYFFITYEDFSLTEGFSTKVELLNFLNVEPNPCLIQPRHVKQNPDDLSELIENYDELAIKLQGTSLEKFFY